MNKPWAGCTVEESAQAPETQLAWALLVAAVEFGRQEDTQLALSKPVGSIQSAALEQSAQDTCSPVCCPGVVSAGQPCMAEIAADMESELEERRLLKTC